MIEDYKKATYLYNRYITEVISILKTGYDYSVVKNSKQKEKKYVKISNSEKSVNIVGDDKKNVRIVNLDKTDFTCIVGTDMETMYTIQNKHHAIDSDCRIKRDYLKDGFYLYNVKQRVKDSQKLATFLWKKEAEYDSNNANVIIIPLIYFSNKYLVENENGDFEEKNFLYRTKSILGLDKQEVKQMLIDYIDLNREYFSEEDLGVPDRIDKLNVEEELGTYEHDGERYDMDGEPIEGVRRIDGDEYEENHGQEDSEYAYDENEERCTEKEEEPDYIDDEEEYDEQEHEDDILLDNIEIMRDGVKLTEGELEEEQIHFIEGDLHTLGFSIDELIKEIELMENIYQKGSKAKEEIGKNVKEK